MKLLDLNDPLWKAYPGAFGSVREEVGVLMGEPAGPQTQLRRLKEPAEDGEHLAFDNLCESLSHQMTFYPAMYLVLPYMVKFLGMKSGDYEWQRLIFSEIGQCLATEAFWEGESAPGAPEDILESYREAAGFLAQQAERFLARYRKQLRKEGTFERRWLLLGLYGLLGNRLEAYVMNMNAWESCCVQCESCGYLDEDLVLTDAKQRRKLRPVPIWRKPSPAFWRFRKFLHIMGDWEGEELLAWYYGTYTCPHCGRRQATMEALIRAFDPNFHEPEAHPAAETKPSAPKFSLPKRKPSEAKGKKASESEASGPETPSESGRPNAEAPSGPALSQERVQETAQSQPDELPDVLSDNALSRAPELCGDYPSVLALMERQEYREAADWCARYLESTPDWRLYVLWACCCKAMGRTPELDRCLSAALELDPDNVLILRARCPAVSTTNRYRRHIADLTRLLELDPEHRGCYFVSRAYRFHWTGDPNAAQQDLRNALNAVPDLWHRSADFRHLWQEFGLTEEEARNSQG